MPLNPVAIHLARSSLIVIISCGPSSHPNHPDRLFRSLAPNPVSTDRPSHLIFSEVGFLQFIDTASICRNLAIREHIEDPVWVNPDCLQKTKHITHLSFDRGTKLSQMSLVDYRIFVNVKEKFRRLKLGFSLLMLMVFGVPPCKPIYPRPYCHSQPKKVHGQGRVHALGWGWLFCHKEDATVHCGDECQCTMCKMLRKKSSGLPAMKFG